MKKPCRTMPEKFRRAVNRADVDALRKLIFELTSDGVWTLDEVFHCATVWTKITRRRWNVLLK